MLDPKSRTERRIGSWKLAGKKPMTWGHFEGERVGTPFPLLKCLRTYKTHLKVRKKIKTVLDSYLMPNLEES